MTRIERERNQRSWLKTEKLVVTRKFQDRVQTPHMGNGQDPNLLAWVVDTVISECGENYQFFAEIPREVWSNRLDSNYRRFLDWLVVNEILERNPRYKNDPKNPDDNFPMSFRVKDLNQGNSDQELVVITRKLSRVSHFKDQSKLDDDVTRYVHQCLQEITVNKDLVPIHDPVREAMALYQCRRIWSRCFNLHYGEKSQRLFHSVILMVREGRQNLRLQTPGEDLVYCDVKTCYPNLLVSYINDPNERDLWIDALNKDLYDVARTTLQSSHSREKVKVHFSKFLSDPKHPTNNVAGRFLETHFPHLLKTIQGDANMALNLQNLEASILVQQMVNWAIQHRIWYVPMFDGFLCKHHQINQIKDQAANLLEKRLKHRPIINHQVLG